MPKSLATTVVSVFFFCSFLGAQTAPPKGVGTQLPAWNDVPPMKSAYAGVTKRPAPPHDIFGIWNGETEGGIQPNGALAHPSVATKNAGGQADERNITHPIPYTPAGLKALELNKPTAGVRAVRAGLQNDPGDICDPVGFPRLDLFQFRVLELVDMQKDSQVLALHQYTDTWRVIWTDGRELPKPDVAEPRWVGYSVGKWVDDYTFVVETTESTKKTRLDNAGRPHSFNMQVEERYHRVDFDTLELTVTITDPEFYTQPWKPLDRFVLHRLPDTFDMQESLSCVPTRIAGYDNFA